jgi:hypothetical protein
MQPELFLALDAHFLFFCKLSNRFLCIEPRVANFFTRSPNYALFVVREWCVYSYAAPSPHSWPSAQVECIKFKHSLMKKIAHGVSRLYMLGRHATFSLFSCLLLLWIPTSEKQTTPSRRPKTTVFYNFYKISMLQKIKSFLNLLKKEVIDVQQYVNF